MKKFFLFTLLINFYSNYFGQAPSYNEEFTINTYLYSIQREPSIAVLNNESFVVCWTSDGQDAGYAGIYAQIFDKNCIRTGEEFHVNTFAEGRQNNPEVCGLSNGGFVISWNSALHDNRDEGVYAQLFDSIGAKVGEEIHVNTYLPKRQEFSAISNLSNGRFIICWESQQQDSSRSGIYAQIFNNNGGKIGNEFLVNTFTEDNQTLPSVSSLSNGGFVITWVSNAQIASGTEIYAQLYNNDGAKIGGEFIVNTFTYSWQHFPNVKGLNNGGFIIAWYSDDQDGSDEGIFAQIFDKDGNRIGNEFQVNSYFIDEQRNPVVQNLSNDRFLIAWESFNQDGSNWGVYSQIYNYDGTKFGQEFRVNSYTNNYQKNISAAENSDGRIFFCWEGWGENYESYEIIGKYFQTNPVVHNLTPFDLKLPLNSSVINEPDPLLVWEAANETEINFPWELTYDLYIADNINFEGAIIQKDIQDTTIQMSMLINNQTYYWKISANNISGESLWSSGINYFNYDTNAVVGINKLETELPKKFELSQNYPNPFNPTTKIKFTIPVSEAFNASAANVKLTVYDLLGNEIAILVDEPKLPGSYEVEFDASVSRRISSGIYFYNLKFGKITKTNKMLLMK